MQEDDDRQQRTTVRKLWENRISDLKSGKFKMRIKYFVCIKIFCLMITLGQAEEATNINMDESPNYSHVICASPYTFNSWGLRLGYELRIKQKFSTFIDAARGSSEDYYGILGVRYYLDRSLHGSYFGTFFKYYEFENAIETEEDGEVIKNRLIGEKLWAVGLHFGKRFIWKTGISINYRIGYSWGNTDLKWAAPPHKDAKIAKKLSEYFLRIDGELTIGYAF